MGRDESGSLNKKFVLASTALCWIIAVGCGASGGQQPGREDGGKQGGSRDCGNVVCPVGQICSNGSCISENLDEDGDGTPVSRDCDDKNPYVTTSARKACTNECGTGEEVCLNGQTLPC